MLPLWNPVLLAEQLGTLASIADGRLILQTAIGGGADQFGGMGEALVGRTARFEQGVDIVRRLLAGERVTAEYGDVEIRDACIAPITPDPLEVWIGGSADVAIARAAPSRRRMARERQPHACREACDQAAFYLAECDELGRVPTADRDPARRARGCIRRGRRALPSP